MFTSIAPPNIAPSPDVIIATPIQVQTQNLYTFSWGPVSNANVAYIRYDFTTSLPSMTTQYDTCTTKCYASGYPNNWMVEIPTTVGISHTLTTNVTIWSMPHINLESTPLSVKVTTYSATG